MKKTTVIVFVVSLALLAGLIYYGVMPLFVKYLVPQQAAINNMNLEMYIDKLSWSNNTNLDWGLLDVDSVNIIANFTVANTGTTPTNITLHVVNLPTGWSLTWVANGTIVQPDNYAWAALELYVASDATPGETYNWDMWVYGEQT